MTFIYTIECIRWVLNGTAFHVRDRKRLESEVLPKFFRHAKLTSFQRQLSLYGIRRRSHSDEAYSHPQLIEGRPELVGLIKRKSKEDEDTDGGGIKSHPNRQNYKDSSTNKHLYNNKNNLSSSNISALNEFEINSNYINDKSPRSYHHHYHHQNNNNINADSPRLQQMSHQEEMNYQLQMNKTIAEQAKHQMQIYGNIGNDSNGNHINLANINMANQFFIPQNSGMFPSQMLYPTPANASNMIGRNPIDNNNINNNNGSSSSLNKLTSKSLGPPQSAHSMSDNIEGLDQPIPLARGHSLADNQLSNGAEFDAQTLLLLKHWNGPDMEDSPRALKRKAAEAASAANIDSNSNKIKRTTIISDDIAATTKNEDLKNTKSTVAATST